MVSPSDRLQSLLRTLAVGGECCIPVFDVLAVGSGNTTSSRGEVSACLMQLDDVVDANGGISPLAFIPVERESGRLCRVTTAAVLKPYASAVIGDSEATVLLQV